MQFKEHRPQFLLKLISVGLLLLENISYIQFLRTGVYIQRIAAIHAVLLARTSELETRVALTPWNQRLQHLRIIE